MSRVTPTPERTVASSVFIVGHVQRCL